MSLHFPQILKVMTIRSDLQIVFKSYRLNLTSCLLVRHKGLVSKVERFPKEQFLFLTVHHKITPVVMTGHVCFGLASGVASEGTLKFSKPYIMTILHNDSNDTFLLR